MFRSWKAPILVVAGSVSVIALAGCPNAGSQPPVPTANSGASASPSGQDASGANSGSTNTGNTGNNGTPTTPTATATPAAGKLPATTVRGKVYDEAGATVDGATVRVRSLAASSPFDSTVNVIGGSYVVNEVPAGVQVEITATKDGWTKRTRVESLLSNTVNNTNFVNFGGMVADTQDATGSPYFISDYPEIANAGIADKAVSTGEKVAYKLTFSEALSDDNRRRVERGFLITSPFVFGDVDEIAISQSSNFVNNDTTPSMVWNAEGTEMTFSFNAPLLANSDSDRTYSVSVRQPNGVELIRDKNNKALGMGVNDRGYYPAFKLSSLKAPAADTASARWTATHYHLDTFDVKKDEIKPVVTGVAVKGANRIEITFSKPMSVYLAPDQTYQRNLLDLSKYTFRVSNTASGLDGTTWSDTAAATAVGSPKATWSTITEGAQVFALDAAGATIQISPSDPKTVRIVGAANDGFSPNIKALMVRVDGSVSDPAGNTVESAGDKNYKAGTI